MNKYRVTYKYYNANSTSSGGTHTSSLVKANTTAEARAIIKSRYYKVVFIKVEKL